MLECGLICVCPQVSKEAYVENVDFLSFQASVLDWDEQLAQRSSPFALPKQSPLPTEQKAEWEPKK